jgi:hypothetical protein
VLEPRVSVNIDHPGCWNKDGLVDPMAVWKSEVEAALRAAGVAECTPLGGVDGA